MKTIHNSVISFLTMIASQLHAAPSTEVYKLEDFIVSAGPDLRSITDYAAPVDVVTAEELTRDSGGTLGAILDWQPGVSATSFSSGASRPVLRGFDGPRVRILESGIEALDASDTSPDHGVAVEPLLVERIEVLRGPSTLLYGGSAIGGAINVIDKSMPHRMPNSGIEGGLEARYDTVSEGQTYIGHATVGKDNWALAVTGLHRDAEDYQIPGEAIEEEEEEAETKKLENSFYETDLYSVGASWFFSEGNRIGVSYSRYESGYGVLGHGHEDDHGGGGGGHEDEETITIDLKRDRYDLELELTDPATWVEALRVRFGYTDYTHTELENGSTGTIFERKGWELRSEAAHTPWALADEGVIGMQLSDTDFEAIGDEAFTPPSNTQLQSLFFSQHIHGNPLHYEFGGRIERADISADERDSNYDEIALSLAASAIWEIDEEQSLSLLLQRAQRHPTSTELYADGEHAATRQYEIGDSNLDLETAYGADLTYLRETARLDAEVSVFYTYFEDYIFAQDLDFETEELHTYQFVAVDAQFYGLEAQFDYRLLQSEETELLLSVMADWVRASNEESGDDLPRIPPMRIGSRLALVHENWDAGLELRYAFEQQDTGPEETGTSDYLLLNADFSRRFDIMDGKNVALFLRGENLLNQTIRNHSSYLKDEAPLPGRNLTIGARLLF